MNYMDMLSKLGAGSAHPGGFLASLEQFQRFPLSDCKHVLEVGCGTGRTSCYLAEQGFQVTAVDIHSKMIEKARKRAQKQGVEVQFIQADTSALPFPSEQFDVIIAESVTNFTQAERSLQEYYRVLKPGGMLYDREVLAARPMPETILAEIQTFFGIPRLRNQEEWLDLIARCQFIHGEFVEVRAFDQNTMEQQNQLDDPHQVIDQDALLDASVYQTAARHLELIVDNGDYLSYGLMRASKPVGI